MDGGPACLHPIMSSPSLLARSEEGAAPRDSAEYLTEMPRVKFDSVLLEVKHY